MADPAGVGPLKLRLTYRGGAVVYLNGREIARGDMPTGKIEPLTLARDYTEADVVGPDGGPLRPTSRGRLPRGAKAADYAKRFRTLSVALPADSLRKGSNVLAVELHRAALPDGDRSDRRRLFVEPPVGQERLGHVRAGECFADRPRARPG